MLLPNLCSSVHSSLRTIGWLGPFKWAGVGAPLKWARENLFSHQLLHLTLPDFVEI